MALRKPTQIPMRGLGAVKKNIGKGAGKAGKRRGNTPAPAAGAWMFVANRGKPLMALKGKGQGKGKGKPQSKFLEKLQKIDSSRKVWLGGLNPNTNWKALEKHVQEIVGEKPSITEILPKGKACLAFKTDAEAESAIALVNETELQGKTIQADVWTQREKKERPDGANDEKRKKKQRKPKTLEIAKPGFAKRNASKTQTKATRGDPKIREKLDKVDNELKVWVGGLTQDTNAGKLRKCFAEAGHRPHLLNLTGKDRACLSFKTADEASGAIAAMNGHDLDGSVLEVDVWTQATEEEKAARREEQKARREAAKAEKKEKKLAA